MTTYFILGLIFLLFIFSNYIWSLCFSKLKSTIYPTAFHTVDIAIVREHNGQMQLLLTKKHKEVLEPFWRFPGGFVDPEDINAEYAAKRETKEETGMNIAPPIYISSRKIDDPRYRNSKHKIITSFFYTTWVSGKAGLGFDDIAITHWFDLEDIKPELINEIHRGLFTDLKNYIQSKN
jgi:ADP-ribose pyrophosphatase YjhB (NUDIX family)